jgi:hypothetical protein
VADNDGFEEGFVPIDRVVELKKHRRFKLIRVKGRRIDGAGSYLVKGLIPRTGLVVIWGPPKCGKSFWTFDLMLHVALGWPYRDHRVHQGSVIYCAFEGADGFNARAEAFYCQHSDVGDPDFYLVPAVMDLFTDHRQLITDIRAQVTPGDTPAAIVLDTLNRSLVGSESSDEDMAKYVRAADVIRETFGCVVIIIHHCGINETRPRGHTSLTGAADAQLAVKRDEVDNVVVTVEWFKDGPEGEVLRSRLERVELGIDGDGDPITSCVIRPLENGDTFKGGKGKLSPSARTVLTMLAEAINDLGTIPSPHPRIPPGTRTTRTTDFRSYCYAGTISDSDNPDSKSKAFRRAVSELQAAHIIGVWQDHVWIAGQAGQSRT